MSDQGGPDPLLGRQVGDYKIVSVLGEGGMGKVYKGQHVALGQIVAVKSLHATLMNNQSAKDRFIREAQALARVTHPNIISLLNFINDERGCYIIMEFAEGEDIECKIQKMGLIPPAMCIPWFVEACRGLSFAHKQGIVHRDIKPSNLIVHPSGRTKLLDFGTAKLVDAKKLTQQGMTLGTIIYMSKEQLLGKSLDARSDVYSLGVTLYECLTGKLPFYDEEERKLVIKIAKTEPIPPSQHYPGISPELERVVLKAMAKEPEQRFQTADEMEQALLALLGPGAMVANSQANAGPRPAMPGPAPAPVPMPGQAPMPLPGPAPTPMPAAMPMVGGGAPVGPLFLQPLFLVGMAMAIMGIGVGAPVALAVHKVAGLIVLLVLSLLGAMLVIVGYLQWSNASRMAGGGVAPAPVPVPMPGPPAASGSGAGAKCPSCGRALLAGMTSCPFCNPPAAAPGAAPVAPVAMAATFSPGGTLNVNSANAAGSYGAPGAPAAPRAPAGVVSLQIIDGADKGKAFQLTRSSPPFVMGRAPVQPGGGVTLNDPGVSGQHAQVSFEGPNLFVADMGSRNGVFVNNQKVQKQQLGSGDLIVVGSTRMLVTF